MASTAVPPLLPGQQPTPQQIAAMQQQIAAEAQKRGMSVPQFVEQLKAQAARQQQTQQVMAQHQQAQGPAQGQGQGQPQQQMQGQPMPVQPGPPRPEAIAVASFLRSQDLKSRTCIFQEKRKDMFKVKRALRALQSDAYAKVQRKNPILPAVTDRASAEQTFKLLPLSLLALRVSKMEEPADGAAQSKKQKRVKGLWTVRVEQQQDTDDMYHYVWLYEGSQWKQKLYAGSALAAIMAVVMFPLWPLFLRQGVWYLSMACLGVVALFFAMAIFRLILFVVTMFAAPPGLWLYPNLFEDVGFFDSFKPTWAWHETEAEKKAVKKEKKQQKAVKRAARAQKGEANGEANGKADAPATAADNGTSAPAATGSDAAGSGPAESVRQRDLNARVETVEEE